MRLACPAVKLRSFFQSDGEHDIGGFFFRSKLPRLCLEIPLVLLASDPGMLGLGPERSPPLPDPDEETRRALEAVVGVKTLNRRGMSFLAECIAVRSFRGSKVLDSESEPEALPCGGQFSSAMGPSEYCGLFRTWSGSGGGDMLPLLAASRARSGETLLPSVSGELDDRFRLSDGG